MTPPPPLPAPHEEEAVERTRWQVLGEIEAWLETPMIVLGLIWMALLLVELIWGLDPFLRDVGVLIWIAFVLDFLLRFALAPRKLRFLRVNALTVVSLALPAIRVLRVVRLLRLARGLRLVQVLGSLNRGLSIVRRTLRRRQFGYVATLTLMVIVIGAAGMYGLERGAGGPGFGSYGEPLWWTARILMTIGPEVWPVTPEGRLLSLGLALYGLAMFGYITAAFASLFIDRDAARDDAEIAGTQALRALQAEIRELRRELRQHAPDRG